MPHKDPEERRAYNLAYGRTVKCRLRKQRHRAELSDAAKRLLRRKSDAYWKKINDATKGRVNHGKRWEEWEISMLWDTSYTINQIASILDRSYHSVKGARRNYAVYAPANYRHIGDRKADLSPAGEKP